MDWLDYSSVSFITSSIIQSFNCCEFWITRPFQLCGYFGCSDLSPLFRWHLNNEESLSRWYFSMKRAINPFTKCKLDERHHPLAWIWVIVYRFRCDIYQHNVSERQIYILDLILIPGSQKTHLSQCLQNTLMPSPSPYASIKYRQSLKILAGPWSHG